ncbi:glycosyltransferase [Pseudalkalibacillus sp. A8]|uniref:glycosyltransferase n=1 Tax=Pseudalkalibacillus sp. A8 TaxID=3382641 RepID=UPI0038B451A2
MKKILILSNYYLPGYKAGGPIQSIANLVEHLDENFDFKVITKDRDIGDERSYDGIKVDGWNFVDNANVYYHSPNKFDLKVISNLLKNTEYNILYLNSFFSKKYAIYPLILKKLNIINKPIVLAPRGELSKGALSLKRKKKILFINITKVLGLYKNIIWHATNELEKAEIKKIFGENISVKIASNLPKMVNNHDNLKRINKDKGKIKIIYLSRITPKKNLKFALNLLKEIKDLDIEFNIYGGISDKGYWKECEMIIEQMPPSVKVKYNGPISHNLVSGKFRSNHVFLLPTLGENYGHVIYESLSNGCVPIISDQTPWGKINDLKAGCSISLESTSKYISVIKKFTAMDNTEFSVYSNNAINYANSYVYDQNLIEESMLIFED